MWKQTVTAILVAVVFSGVRGVDVDWKDQTNIVAVVYKGTDQIVTTAALISIRAALTSASSLAKQPNTRPDNLQVRFPASLFARQQVRDVKLHPNYQQNSDDNDIAIVYFLHVTLLSLHAVIPYSIHPIGLNKTVAVIEVDKSLRRLKFTAVNVVGSKNGICNSSETVLCGKSVDPSSPCQGNNGAPIIDVENVAVVGISPYKPEEKCKAQRVVPYLRTDAYQHWIQESLNSLPFLNFNTYLANALGFVNNFFG